MPFKDPEKQKAYSKEYRKNNRIQLGTDHNKLANVDQITIPTEASCPGRARGCLSSEPSIAFGGLVSPTQCCLL